MLPFATSGTSVTANFTCSAVTAEMIADSAAAEGNLDSLHKKHFILCKKLLTHLFELLLAVVVHGNTVSFELIVIIVVFRFIIEFPPVRLVLGLLLLLLSSTKRQK